MGLPYLEPVEWSSIATGLEISYMITGGVRADIKFINSLVEGEESWTAPHLYGKTNYLQRRPRLGVLGLV